MYPAPPDHGFKCRPFLRPAVRAAPLLVLLLVASAGCATKTYPDAPGTSSSPTPTLPTHPAYANHRGDWSGLNGTFQLYATETVVEQWDAGGSRWEALAPQCERPPLPYFYNETSGELWLDREVALHPSDPGPLTGVWIQREVYGPQCDWGGFFGINEDPMARSLPLLPSRTNYQDTFLFLNVSFDRLSIDPPRHTVTVDNETFDDEGSGNVTYEGRDAQGQRFRASVGLEYLGAHPYSSIRRF